MHQVFSSIHNYFWSYFETQEKPLNSAFLYNSAFFSAMLTLECPYEKRILPYLQQPLVPFNQQIAIPSFLSSVLSTTHRKIEKYTIKKKTKTKKWQKKKRPEKRKRKHQLRKQKIPNPGKNKRTTKNRNTPIKRKNIPKNDHQNEKKNASFLNLKET